MCEYILSTIKNDKDKKKTIINHYALTCNLDGPNKMMKHTKTLTNTMPKCATLDNQSGL